MKTGFTLTTRLVWRLLALLPVDLACADTETDAPGSQANFQVHGFLTQGFFYTDKNNYFGDSPMVRSISVK